MEDNFSCDDLFMKAFNKMLKKILQEKKRRFGSIKRQFPNFFGEVMRLTAQQYL